MENSNHFDVFMTYFVFIGQYVVKHQYYVVQGYLLRSEEDIRNRKLNWSAFYTPSILTSPSRRR